MNLYLIRHGLSEGNKDRSIYFKMRDWEIPLAEEGYIQAQNVANDLKKIFKSYVRIITSPYVRAKQTAEVITSYFDYYGMSECPLIHERLWGNLREEVESFPTREERKHLFDFYRRPDGGESFADCYQRAFIFLEHLKKIKYDDVIIVSHGEFLKVLLMIIDAKTIEEFDKMPNIKNCEIIKRYIDV